MSKMQRNKGARFERSIVQQIKAKCGDAYEVRRGLQSQSGTVAPDVEVIARYSGERVLWVECKHGIKPNIRAALGQAVSDSEECQDDPVPVAIIKDNWTEPLAVMRFADFVDLMEDLAERSLDTR